MRYEESSYLAASVGSAIGTSVSPAIGTAVATAVGSTIGTAVSSAVATAVGAPVSSSVGATVVNARDADCAAVCRAFLAFVLVRILLWVGHNSSRGQKAWEQRRYRLPEPAAVYRSAVVSLSGRIGGHVDSGIIEPLSQALYPRTHALGVA
ncbi:hypothetical protein ACPCXD_18075 [Rhodococcus sp. AB351]|uniref:hypothetical protein n=1 Tax=Rhodococcus sp. AB351 TaxID=3413280 RepID=UPI003C1646AD